MKGTSPDGFGCGHDHPRAAEHGRLDQFLIDPKNSTLAGASAKLEKRAQLTLLLAAKERIKFQKGSDQGETMR